MDEKVKELLEFFKALADANRLKIVGCAPLNRVPPPDPTDKSRPGKRTF